MAVTAPGSPYVETSDLVANYPGVSESLAERVDLVGVLPFADSTARGTALPSPTDGQYSYLQDTNATEYYNGSAWVAAGVAPGLVHINTTTFSAVSSVSLNDVFTSTYQNYRVIMTAASSSNQDLNIRFRVSATDTTTNYVYQTFSVNGAVFTGASAGSATLSIIGIVGTTFSLDVLDIASPQLAAPTVYRTFGVSSSGSILLKDASGAQTASTAFDGFTLFPTSGTFTGTVRVYGYKNS